MKETKIWIQCLSLIILLVPIFLISFGTTDETTALWWIGLILIGVGGVIPPVTRYTFSKKGDKNKSNKKEKDEK